VDWPLAGEGRGKGGLKKRRVETAIFMRV